MGIFRLFTTFLSTVLSTDIKTDEVTADLYPYLSLESNNLVNLEQDKLARAPLGKGLLVYTKCKNVDVFSFLAMG